MAVNITGIEQNSIAAKLDIKVGDTLISIGNDEINDVLDYQFFACDTSLSIELLRLGIPYNVKVSKDEYEDMGLEFQSYLMDEQRRCTNSCVFCFIDQNPKGMRETVYFKDDDDRLSFLFGNYITLTNLKAHDVHRIIRMHINPINISVHTTNGDLRCKMMGNRFAGESLEKLDTLAKAGIKLNIQLVLCPGINDGDELIHTLTELGKLIPSVQSIACVPVGLTAHREGLPKLTPFDAITAGKTIDIIESFSTKWEKIHNSKIVFPADELFLLAKRGFPKEEYYEDFPQLDNGVGLISSTISEFKSVLKLTEPKNTPRHYTLVTGEAAYPTISMLSSRLMEIDGALQLDVHMIKNLFFGGEVTVAGLVTGSDIVASLKNVPLCGTLLIPSCMLRHERDKFLDDMTLEELSAILKVDVDIIEPDGGSLAELIER